MDETQMQPVAPGGIGEMGSPEQAAMYQAAQKADPQQIARDSIDVARELDPRTTDQFVQQLRALNLDKKSVDALLMIIDGLLNDPQNYAANRQELIDAGAPEELLPEQFDPQFLGAMKLGLQSIQQEQQEVQGFAKGGIVSLKPLAREMAKMGRGGDKHLVHVNDEELKMLKSMGGMGTINPYTGLREYGWLSKAWKSVTNTVKSVVKPVVNAVKDFVQSDIGRIVTTIAIGAIAGPALAGYLGVTSAAGVAGISAALGAGGTTLLGGGSLKDAIKAAAISGGVAFLGTGLISGFDKPYAPTPAGAPPVEAGSTENARDALLARGEPTGGLPSPPSPGGEIASVGTQSVSAGTAAQAPIQQAAQVVNAPNVSSLPTVGYDGTQYMNIPTETGNYLAPVNSMQPAMVSEPMLTGSNALTPVPATAQMGVPAPVTAPVSAPVAGGPGVPVEPGGIANARDALLARGDMTGGAASAPPSFYDQYIKPVVQPVQDFYNEYLSPTRGMPTDAEITAKANDIYASSNGNITYDKAVDMATKSLTPGFISQYGPLTAAGVGTLALAGGFSPEKPPEPSLTKGPTGEELLAQDPGKYMPNIFAGQTPVSYANFNPNYYQARTYGSGQSPFAPVFNRRFMSMAAKGGEQKKGIESLSQFPRRTGQISGPGTETSDSIPAKLSDGEFVMTARAVRGMGNGSRRLGAKRMYQLMAALEKRSGGRK